MKGLVGKCSGSQMRQARGQGSPQRPRQGCPQGCSLGQARSHGAREQAAPQARAQRECQQRRSHGSCGHAAIQDTAHTVYIASQAKYIPSILNISIDTDNNRNNRYIPRRVRKVRHTGGYT